MRPKRTGCSIKYSLKSAIAFLILASASLVEAQTLQTLCSFNTTNGAYPMAALTLGSAGNLYGTTSQGGITNSLYWSGMGTIFRVTTDGTLTTLVSFNGNNGAGPSGLTLGNDGNFYGTTDRGIFKVTTNGMLTVLVGVATGGANALALGNDGNFYGTTVGGGSDSVGTVFQVTTNGTLTTLVSFNGTNGANPSAGLTLGNDGSFYGTTVVGGITNSTYTGGMGTVFKVTTNGMLTTLVAFSYANGASPSAGLTLGNDGNFYGTTGAGGSGGSGTVFKVTTNGTLTTLVAFNWYNGGGANALTLGSDGNFYGTTADGGSSGDGTVFQVMTNGTLTTLYSFMGGNDGEYPYAALTLGSDGNFYGTTSRGGSSSGRHGTVFRLLLPLITVQPQSQTNNAGAAVTFLVSATDPNPIGFQWQKNGTNLVSGGNISGATTSTLTIMSISDSDAASYSVIVSNSNRSVTSSIAALTVIDPPVITAQPTSLLLLPGATAVFAVSLGGTAPFGYQWQFNGTNLLNATNALYSIPSVGTNNAGNYSVVVTNAAGSATSSNAALTVVLSPQSQTNYAKSTATFTATAFSPEWLNYQWQKNGTNLVEGGRLSGTTNNTLTIASVSDADAASYRAVVSDASASVTTSNAVLTVIDPPLITAQPSSLLVLPGTNVAFGLSVASTVPLGYQWRFNGTNIANATSALYPIPSVGTNNVGNYSVVVTNAAGSATSSNAALSVVLSPKSQTNYASTTATLTATAFSPELLNYQWQKNGTNLMEGGRLSGTTNSTLTIASVLDTDAASYGAVVSDAYASVTTSNAVLTVNDSLLIASQPQSQTVLAGATVAFNVTVYGAPPFVFQWYCKGTPLGPPADGTNFSSCTLTNVGINQAGDYSVEVVNGYGTVTSSNATLTVLTVSPAITAQPASRTNNATTTAAFSVVASGFLPLSYQWQKNGTNLVNGGKVSGATTNSLSITSVSDNEAASYSVIVTNLLGSTTSSNATLTVIDPPVITTQPLSRRVLLGGSVSFNVSLSGTAPFSYQWRFNGSGILNATNAPYAIQAVGANNTGSYSVVVTNSAGSATSSGAFLTVTIPPTLALQLWAGYPLLDLNGMLSSNFVVQYSTNLAGSNWMNLLSLSNLPASPYLFLDPAGDGEPARFYRAFMQ
jgi:uncharacterized repeat protein (TIGR03803 family)